MRYCVGMHQKEFDQLVERYLQGNVSEQEKSLIDRWYQAISPSVNPLTPDEAAKIKERLQIELKAHRDKAKHSRQMHLPLYTRWAKFALPIAACTIFILIASILLVTDSFEMGRVHSGRVAIAEREDWKEIVNTTSSRQIIALQDGSEIVLAPYGVLEYPMRFATHKREVRLKTGSAFFQIQEDADRPFYVYAAGLVTKVLGTSFCVNAEDDGTVSVDVRTGTVMVSRLAPNIQKSGNEVILRPNQRADFDPKRQIIARTLVEKPRIVIPSKEVARMTFEKAPVASILHAVEKAYEVDIRFDSVKLSPCVLTTHLIPEEDLYTRLKIICEAIDASYRLEDGYIRIIGKGC